MSAVQPVVGISSCGHFELLVEVNQHVLTRRSGESRLGATRQRAVLGAARHTNDQISLQHDAPAARTGFTRDSFQQKLSTEASERLSRLVYYGEKRGEHGKVFDI